MGCRIDGLVGAVDQDAALDRKGVLHRQLRIVIDHHRILPPPGSLKGRAHLIADGVKLEGRTASNGERTRVAASEKAAQAIFIQDKKVDKALEIRIILRVIGQGQRDNIVANDRGQAQVVALY